MASLLDIRRRIRSVKNTQQITRAMKMVAAAKLRRAQEKVVAARPYARTLRAVLESVAARVDPAGHVLFATREEKKVALVVASADKGLCGGFNGNIFKETNRQLASGRWGEPGLVLIGRKGYDYFRRRPTPVLAHHINIYASLDFAKAAEIAQFLIGEFSAERVDAIYVVYNEFKSIIAQNLTVEKLLPLPRPEKLETTDVAVDYIYEPGPDAILTELLPRYVEFQLYRIMLETSAAEHGARMTAMDGASKNAAEMIEGLTLTYNRARQARITKELIEIVSGAAAAQ